MDDCQAELVEALAGEQNLIVNKIVYIDRSELLSTSSS